MHLLECNGLAKDYGADPLFSGLDFAIDAGQKVGIVGRNGSGKTSLVRILAGQDTEYSGRVARVPGLRVALVPQHFEPVPGLTCSQLLCSGAYSLAQELASLGEAMATLSGRDLDAALVRYGDLRSRYDELGGEEAPQRASRLLARAGLGAAAEREACLLSGGEKNVVALVLALMADPSLLILDEPGNHLDFAGLAWLEDFIAGERRAVLLISHNRYLLDRTVDRILELEGGTGKIWAGGYSSYRLEKLRQLAGQGKDWQADRKKIERLEALVKRFAVIAASRADPAWGKRLRARRSQLEREKAQATDKPDSGGRRLSVEFTAEGSKSDFALVLSGYSKAFGERRLFQDASFDLLTGEKAAIVGPNGSGKTTLLRDIVATGSSWDGDTIKVGPSLVIGYCAQNQEVFEPQMTVGQAFTLLGAKDTETVKLLRRYLFDASVLDRKVGDLSGGERNRLQIARAVWLKATFLILDEPTNHLDIESREAVEEALADFEGTILSVSHDRYFLEKVAERIFILDSGTIQSYEGTFSEFWRDVGTGFRGAPTGTQTVGIEDRGKVAGSGASRPNPARTGSPERNGGRGSGGGQGLQPGTTKAQLLDKERKRRLEDLERRIGDLESRKEKLERESAAALTQRDYARAGRLADEAAKTARQAEKLVEEWSALG